MPTTASKPTACAAASSSHPDRPRRTRTSPPPGPGTAPPPPPSRSATRGAQRTVRRAPPGPRTARTAGQLRWFGRPRAASVPVPCGGGQAGREARAAPGGPAPGPGEGRPGPVRPPTAGRHPQPPWWWRRVGRAVRTACTCDYLTGVELRLGIHEGLQVVENQNSANQGRFYGNDGDPAGSDQESQKAGTLALHLFQSTLVHVNTC
ncbi:Tn3 family transposase [Kitasatospora sp. NPDC092039]|uniref:Tn3 family transposase n=1 Tax=Kitasatospora sp. NPDC092039 TaxID=3364086 RepID=UPI0038204BAE